MQKYPFLPQARQHIAPLGFDIKDLANLPPVSERAKERIRTSFDLTSHRRLALEPNKQFETEIASFPLAVYYAGGSRDSRLIERFALHEATQINRYLDSELNDDIISEIAKTFKWDFHFQRETHMYSLHFAKYLQMGSKGRLFHDPKWRLISRRLEGGQVYYLTTHDFRRLLQEEVKKYIEDRAKQELGKIEPDVQKDIDELKAEFLKKLPQLAEFDLTVYARAQISEYPPCISDLLKRASQGQHLSHVERFTLVTYLLHQGVSIDSVVSVFSGVADFKEDKTRYQVEHLAGETGNRTPYLTYNCATLQTHGVCSNPTDPICRTIRNPLTYHLRKQGRSEVPVHERTQSGQTRKRTRSKKS
jgi:DNA primase large subunit